MKEKIILEGCIDNKEDALYLYNQGVNRFEICSDLNKGGLSPDIGLVDYCLNELKIDSVVMLRNRDDFSFNASDLETFNSSIKAYKSIGINQFIFGYIKDGEVDVEACKAIISLLGGSNYCFHMAVDSTNNIFKAIETLINLGFKRVLTKGGSGCAMDNIDTLKELVNRYNNQIEILVGGKVTRDN